jgi:hypothetical protein
MKTESMKPSIVPPIVADRLDGLDGMMFEHLETPSIEDLIESQIEDIEAWDIEDSNVVLDHVALWDIRCRLAIIGILADMREREASRLAVDREPFQSDAQAA